MNFKIGEKKSYDCERIIILDYENICSLFVTAGDEDLILHFSRMEIIVSKCIMTCFNAIMDGILQIKSFLINLFVSIRNQ